jgi:glycosyltransferase involved in cell wall biosynthesis
VRLFFITASLPLAGHSVRAPTVVAREALQALRDLGHDVVLQPLLPPAREAGFAEAEARALEWARAAGIEPLPALEAPPDDVGGPPGRLVRLATSRDPGLFYPSYRLRDEVARRVAASGADVVLHLWASAAFAACHDVDRPVYAYAGNPDHYAMTVRLRYPELFDVPTATPRNRVRVRVWREAYRRFEAVALRMVARSTWVGCVSAPNARYYSEHGHPRAFYVQNMWPRLPTSAPTGAGAEPGKIVGNIGGQYATGNTFGLALLGRGILPELDRRLGDRYSVHLYGAGKPFSGVAASLAHPRVLNRGFVADIDAELQSAQVFLLANNNNPDYVIGHTRVLHAWSLGSCMVAHRNMALAMPEIVHGENALLGETAEELAEHVATAVHDEELRLRIGEAGRRTWEREFLPPVVIRRVIGRIQADLASGVAGAAAQA